MAKKYENIENIGKLISGGSVAELTKKLASAEKQASDILRNSPPKRPRAVRKNPPPKKKLRQKKLWRQSKPKR